MYFTLTHFTILLVQLHAYLFSSTIIFSVIFLGYSCKCIYNHISINYFSTTTDFSFGHMTGMSVLSVHSGVIPSPVNGGFSSMGRSLPSFRIHQGVGTALALFLLVNVALQAQERITTYPDNRIAPGRLEVMFPLDGWSQQPE